LILLPSSTFGGNVIPGEFFQKGMSLYPVPEAPYGSDACLQSLIQMKVTNIEWVAVIFTWNQNNINSTTIFAPSGFSEAGLNTTIKQALSLGLKVMLKPHIDPLDGHWRAWIGYYFNATQWDAWFQSYTAFIVHFAALSEGLGVFQFSAGVEYISASAQTQQWLNIINKIRAVFNGNVTYAANWGNLYEVFPPGPGNELTERAVGGGGEINWIQWLDVLDVIGCDAYFPLTNLEYPALYDLEQGWQVHIADLQNISTYWNKNIIFTEIGYRSIPGTAIHPGWWNITAPANETQQLIAYESTFNVLLPQSWWQGIFWWSWSTNANCGGPTDTGYSPQNKPAQQLIYGVYQKLN